MGPTSGSKSNYFESWWYIKVFLNLSYTAKGPVLPNDTDGNMKVKGHCLILLLLEVTDSVVWITSLCKCSHSVMKFNSSGFTRETKISVSWSCPPHPVSTTIKFIWITFIFPNTNIGYKNTNKKFKKEQTRVSPDKAWRNITGEAWTTAHLHGMVNEKRHYTPKSKWKFGTWYN